MLKGKKLKEEIKALEGYIERKEETSVARMIAKLFLVDLIFKKEEQEKEEKQKKEK